MRKLKQLLISAVFGLMPLAAMAKDTISPHGGNTWDLYVYGNGPAISAILTAIKLMIAPDNGSSSFQYLLLFLATAGFLAMAVKAGFDPAKNFIKMFFFLITIWMVTYLTRGAGANVNVMDPVTNYSNVVQGVPALVAVPAAIISQVGYYLTLQVEQNFTMPNGANAEGLNISAGAEYNLFAKMIGDSTQYTIQDPDLKRSLAAYMSDCVVSAVARGAMPVQALLNSPNLMQDLGAATNQAIMTRYYLTEMQSQTTAQQQQGTFQGPTCGGVVQGGMTTDAAGNQVPTSTIGASGFNTTSPGMGVLVSCDQAYKCLMADMPNMASALEKASAAQWQSSGITVPFDTAMSSAIALAGADGGANPQSGYASPESFILQKAMVSSATGAFRQAATNTGNNEIMLATSLAQAEQSQKTSWVTATEIFKNMMGYVYTVLQAFIFAMVPIVVICLMIPGMGHVVLLNYIQILVWLTLWTPMLAIVNFLIEIFGSSSLGTSLGTDGLTMGNSALVSEQANNMQIVAEFMGTLVPLMTWGLVKGAMAFTEFISHGIGSSFATQAGAQAATGNISMGNIGMDNTTMNKYNTARSIKVGDDVAEAGFNAGHGMSSEETGGAKQTSLGTMTNQVRSKSLSYTFTNGSGETVGVNASDVNSKMDSNTRVAQDAKTLGASVGTDLAAGDKAAQESTKGEGWRAEDADEWARTRAQVISASKQWGADAHASVDAKVSTFALPGIEGRAGAGTESSRNKLQQAQVAFNAATKTAQSHAHEDAEKRSAGHDVSAGAKKGWNGTHQLSDSTADSATASFAEANQYATGVNKQLNSQMSEDSRITQTDVDNGGTPLTEINAGAGRYGADQAARDAAITAGQGLAQDQTLHDSVAGKLSQAHKNDEMAYREMERRVDARVPGSAEEVQAQKTELDQIRASAAAAHTLADKNSSEAEKAAAQKIIDYNAINLVSRDSPAGGITGGGEAPRIDKSGHVIVGTSSPSERAP